MKAIIRGFRACAGTLWLASAACLLQSAQAEAADIVVVPPSDLLKYVQTHDKVVVYFTSPDPKCGFCGKAPDQSITSTAALFGSEVSFIRVEWTPWSQLPPEVRQFGITGVPWTKAYRNGSQVYQTQGKIAEPARAAEAIRSSLRKVGEAD